MIMTETEEKTNKHFIRLNPDAEVRRGCLKYFLAAAILLCGVYLSELFHLLENLFLAHSFYGNFSKIVFAVSSSLYMLAFFVLFHFVLKKKTGITPFEKHETKLSYKRIAVLYVMTVVPVLAVGMALNFQFKIVFELGEKVTGVTVASNLCMYVNAAMKLFCAIYFIFLAETGFRKLFVGGKYVPYGGISLLLTFGLIELFVTASAFSWLYLFLCLYYGLIWMVSGQRFWLTYCLAVILYVL